MLPGVCAIALSRLDCAQVDEERLRGIVRELEPEPHPPALKEDDSAGAVACVTSSAVH